MARCRSCGATVMWVRTTKDKNMPIDADASAGWEQPVIDPEGNVRPTGQNVPGKFGPVPVVQVMPDGQMNLDGERRWRPHWATCPDANDWRRK